MSWLKERILRVLLGVLLAATSPAVQAQNILVNPDFASDLSGWTLQLNGGSITWTPLDANGSATSGSAEVTPVVAGFGTRLTQCLSASGEQTYEAGAKALMPSGQTATGAPTLTVEFWLDSFCTFFIEGEVFFADIVFDAWVPFNTMPLQSPPGTGSVRYGLDLFNTSTLPFTVHFDNAFLDLGRIFVDGFETGDTSAWSNTVS